MSLWYYMYFTERKIRLLFWDVWNSIMVRREIQKLVSNSRSFYPSHGVLAPIGITSQEAPSLTNISGLVYLHNHHYPCQSHTSDMSLSPLFAKPICVFNKLVHISGSVVSCGKTVEAVVNCKQDFEPYPTYGKLITTPLVNGFSWKFQGFKSKLGVNLRNSV